MCPAVKIIDAMNVCRTFCASCLTGLLLLISLYPENSFAGSFSVNPVRVDLSAAELNSVIHVENTSGAPVTIQLMPMEWSQADGKDLLTPTRELLATPQIFRLQPGAVQVVRIGALRRPDDDKDLPYRLILEEIPSPPPPDFKGMQVALKVSMPIFLKPARESREKLDMALTALPDNQLKLAVTNSGTGVAHLSGLSLRDDAAPDKLLATYQNAIYVHPGQRRELTLRTSGIEPGRKVLIKATARGRSMEFHATPASPQP